MDKTIKFLVILCSIIFIFLIGSGIFYFVSSRKTQGAIETIRDQYTKLEKSYNALGAAVTGFGSKLDAINKQYPDLEAAVGRLEKGIAKLNSSIVNSQRTVSEISGTVGNIEETNRQLAELIAEITGSTIDMGNNPK